MSLGLAAGAHRFNSQRGGGPGEAFGRIAGAIRRICGPLRPYAEAAGLHAADPPPR